MKKKHFFLFSTSLFFLAIMNAEPQSSQRLPDTTTLLLSYVENDAELKNLILAAKKSALSYQSAKIDTGFDVTLSSGSVTLQVNDDGTKLTAKPSVKMSLPQASNLSVTAQTNFSSESSNTSLSNTSLSNTSVAVGIDIISSAVISNKLTKLKAERAVTEAQRKIEKRAIAADKEFYTALKNLLSSINTIMTKRQTLYEDSIDFEAIKVQGYSESSSTYRQAELKVISD